MRYLLHVHENEYLLQKEGEIGQAKFATLKQAIDHAQTQVCGRRAKLVVLTRDGKQKLELDL